MIIHVLIGIPGAGKTSWAQQQPLPYVTRDPTLSDPYSGATEAMLQYLLADQDVVYDARNLKRRDRNRVLDSLERRGATLQYHVFFVEPMTAIHRSERDIVLSSLQALQLPETFTPHYDPESVHQAYPLSTYRVHFPDDHFSMHHLERISEHIERYVELAPTPLLREIGRWHDLGKYFTGTPFGPFRVFSNHAEVSAYIYRAIMGEAYDAEVYKRVKEHMLYHDDPDTKDSVVQTMNHLDSESSISYAIFDTVDDGQVRQYARNTQKYEKTYTRYLQKKDQHPTFDWGHIHQMRRYVESAVGVRFDKRTGEPISMESGVKVLFFIPACADR